MRLCAAANGVLEAPGSRPLLRLSLSLPCGVVAVIHGPNGAGKTLLLRRLAGLGPGRFSGSIWSAKPRFYAPPSEIHMQGLLVREWYWLHRQPLPPVLAGKPWISMDNLSRGWRRLAGLLAPTQSRARVMLLDEPFSGLDEERSRLLAGALTGAAARGSLVVVAEPSGAAPRVLSLLAEAGARYLDCPITGGGELRCP